MQIDRVTDPTPAVLTGLAELVIDAVRGGFNMGWITPPAPQAAEQWWRDFLTPHDVTLIAVEGGAVLGTVTLKPARSENAPHRAEVAKLMVHSSAHGRGVAGALMRRLEQEARDRGRTLLMLDTATGSPAESIYPRWGWERFGRVDEYALEPSGRLGGTTFFLKRLAPPPAPQPGNSPST